MKKVLIISYAFPPVNDIASRRYGEMVPFFKGLGWEPYVLTTKSSGDLEHKINERQVYRIGVHPGSKDGRKNNVGFYNWMSLWRRKLGFNFRVFDSSLFKWSGQVLESPDFIHQVSNEGIDVILASYGPSSALRVGEKLGRILGVPVVYDFRDLAALHESNSFKQNRVSKIVDRFFERYYLRAAAGFVTVSNGLAERIYLKYKKDVHVVYNGINTYNPCEGGAARLPSNKSYLYYAGRFYDHRLKSIYLLIDVLNYFDYELVIRSLGPVELEKKIINYAAAVGAGHKLKLLGKANADVVDFESRNAFVNLVFEDLDKSFKSLRGVLTGKFLQLLAYEAPVLAIARDDSEIGEILEDTAKGALASSPDEVYNFIMSLDDYSVVQDRSKINKYTKEEQARSLISYLEMKI